MEIHQLQYVVEVANQRHFTRAADEISVSQSSLSQQINKLEDELGIKLFNRTTRSVVPTSAGSEFIIYARKILAEIETAKQSMQAHAGLTKGTINIGAITTLESIGFVPLITAFHNAYPGLYLNIHQDGSRRLTELLRLSEINVALLTPPVNEDIDDIYFFPLADDEFVLVTANSHPLAKKGTINLAEAADESFIFPSPDQSIYNIYFQACRDAGFIPKIVCQSSHSETSLALVGVGMGIGFFPYDTLRSSALYGLTSVGSLYGLSIVRLARKIKKHIALALSKNSPNPPAVKAFCDFVLDRIQYQATPPAE
ncbi:MAG: LysR family transcriptional regulator [Negativicutes bacterium]|nr:LysR family transcriptional regulator [Negativicutes bacterium]